MKTKLTPELSYIIGLWSRRRSVEGVGITAPPEILQVFVQQALELALTASDKLLIDGDKAYFYHAKYRKFFQQVEEDKLERYKYMNEYSASYLAGVFDGAGGITENGVIYIEKFTPADEILLLRLGFPIKKASGKMLIGKPKLFLTLIKNYTRVFASHPVMDLLKKSKK